MDLSTLNIHVIGGGIGGLAVAAALGQRGARVVLLEQADQISEVGAGVQLSPNARVVLRALGAEADLHAHPAHAVVLHDYRKSEVLRLDLTKLKDQTYGFVHRADLITALQAAAERAGVEIRLGAAVQSANPQTGQINLRTGETLQSDLIIGADGINSVLRPALNGACAPFFTRQTAWRAIVPNVLEQGAEARVYMGPKRHIVCYPLRDGSKLNLVAVQERDTWQAEGWNHFDDPENLRAAFADFGPAPRKLLAAVEDVRFWGLFRHPVATKWHADHAALLGDAAHPMLPFMAQGAAMALEDAWVLAAELAKGAELPESLAAYQARRVARVTRVVSAASGNARKYHLRFPPLRLAAHIALRLGGALAPSRMMRRYDWIYAHDVTRED